MSGRLELMAASGHKRPVGIISGECPVSGGDLN